MTVLYNLGLVCGDGFCNNGAECAEMSSQVCRRMKKDNLDEKRLKGFDEPECSNGICEACKTITEFKCAFKRGMTEPCKTKGCARGRKCVKEEEEVCVVRAGTDISSFLHLIILSHCLADAAAYINGETTHDPEKVRKKFRRFTAIILPIVCKLPSLKTLSLHNHCLPYIGASAAVISVIAFISWATIRVRKARKEVPPLNLIYSLLRVVFVVGRVPR